MLESFNTDNFTYQKLSLEEQQSRGILGRLKGVIADTVNPTRNGRKYSAKLWEKVFADPIMQEKIQNRCLFGELGHPADREETDMEKIALCLAEQPKKGKDGKLYGVFDILNTPNGRILKTLCDYGCNIGISSRGSGDLITDMNGDEAVDEDTYDCQGFDAVLVPAVKEARLAYVNEALSKVKYNKSLKTRLKESLDKASADDKKVMKESLDTLGVNLNEDADLTFVYIPASTEGVESICKANDVEAVLVDDEYRLHGTPEDIDYVLDALGVELNEESLNEGSWTIPDNKESLNKLKKILAKPISPDSAIDKLYYIFGDDDLYDRLANDKEEGVTDCRYTIISSLKELVSNNTLDKDIEADIRAIINHWDPSLDLEEDSEDLERMELNHKLYKDDTDQFMNEETLNEDDLHKVFRKDAKDQYKRFNKKKAAYDDKANKLRKDFKDLGETDPDKIDSYKDIILGDEPVFKYRKGNHSLERQNYPFYVTVYEGTSYFHPEEGGYYQAGLEPAYSEGYKTFEEAQAALQDYLEENSSTTVSFNPSNVSIDDDNYSYAESEEEYKPIYDNKDRLIGAIASGKYVGEEEQVWIEPNKHYLSRQVGYQAYESLNEAQDLSKLLDKDDIRDFKYYIEQAVFSNYRDSEVAKDIANTVMKNMLADPHAGNDIKKNGNVAVDNNEAMVEELQKTLSQNKELQDKLVSLQEKLSVSYAKESKLNEEIDKQKNAISNLRKGATQVIALNRKVKSLEKNNELLESKLKDSETSINRLRESNKITRDKNKSLRESISNRDNSNQKLNEELSDLKNTNKSLTEELESLKKDIEIKKSDYSKKLEQSNQLVEKYKRIAAKSVDKYIGLQALKIGVTSEEIKNKLPESYTFKDIDEACESVKQYKVNINKLPFNTMLNENKNIQIKATPSKNEKLAISSLNEDDDVDDMLMRMANM